MTTTVSNINVREVENKIPDTSKYITTQESNKLTAENFAVRLKQADLVNKTDFDNKLTSFDKTKHLEVQEKLNSLKTNDYNFLLSLIYFTSSDGSQSTFVYQPALFIRKSKGVYSSNLKPSYTAFLNSIKLSGYKMGMKFDKDPLAAEQNNYLTKIVNVYIVYDLNAWSRNPTNNFKFKNCLFGATNIVKNSK